MLQRMERDRVKILGDISNAIDIQIEPVLSHAHSVRGRKEQDTVQCAQEEASQFSIALGTTKEAIGNLEKQQIHLHELLVTGMYGGRC